MGPYHDEDATSRDAKKVTSYHVLFAAKSETVDIPVCLFCDPKYSDVSAVALALNEVNALVLNLCKHIDFGHILPALTERLVHADARRV